MELTTLGEGRTRVDMLITLLILSSSSKLARVNRNEDIPGNSQKQIRKDLEKYVYRKKVLDDSNNVGKERVNAEYKRV